MEKIINYIRSLAKSKKMIIVAIDGMPGGGKSTLLKHIQNEIPDIKVVKMDSFYNLQQKGDDHIRVKSDVLDPLRKGKTANFIIYD